MSVTDIPNDLDMLVAAATATFAGLSHLALPDRIEALNRIRIALAEHSPFTNEPVDCVTWVPNTAVTANLYNPNVVAKAEMELLYTSVAADGYTQPIVAMISADTQTGREYEVIDGFHRSRVGKEYPDVTERIHGYLPLVIIRSDRVDIGDRMASTIRHNRARGKHQVEAMSDIVLSLKRRNWTDKKICKELGMDPDEVLRLCQVAGMADAFGSTEFSEAWEALEQDDFTELVDIQPDDLDDGEVVS